MLIRRVQRDLRFHSANMSIDDNIKEKKYVAEAIKNTVTSEDVNFVVQKYTNDKSVKVLNYKIENYSEGQLGFLGSHRNLKVTLKRSNTSSPEIASFFVKSVPYDCKEQADFLSKEGIFVKESNFFRDIVPVLEKHCKTEKWHPTCYLAKEDAMIMEDLRTQGYKIMQKTFDDTVALKSVLVSLARFHSCSILMESNLNRDLKQSLTLNERYPGYFNEKAFDPNSKVINWVNCGVNVTCFLAKQLGYNPDKIRKACDHVYSLIGPSKTHRNVVCHGDPWSNNIMLTDDSPLHKCILVDFQVVRYAPIVVDLLQFLHLNATRSYREKHEKDAIEFYHSVLRETIKSNDSTGSVKVPTLEEILIAMDELRLVGLVTTCLYFPIALMDADVAAECTKDSDSYDQFMFNDRIKQTLAHMEVNKFYKKSVEDAVIELADKCNLLY